MPGSAERAFRGEPWAPGVAPTAAASRIARGEPRWPVVGRDGGTETASSSSRVARACDSEARAREGGRREGKRAQGAVYLQRGSTWVAGQQRQLAPSLNLARDGQEIRRCM